MTGETEVTYPSLLTQIEGAVDQVSRLAVVGRKVIRHWEDSLGEPIRHHVAERPQAGIELEQVALHIAHVWGGYSISELNRLAEELAGYVPELQDQGAGFRAAYYSKQKVLQIPHATLIEPIGEVVLKQAVSLDPEKLGVVLEQKNWQTEETIPLNRIIYLALYPHISAANIGATRPRESLTINDSKTHRQLKRSGEKSRTVF